MPRLTVDDAEAFLREHHRAVLATTRRDGRPQMSPVLVALGDDGRAVISSREGAMKVRNLRRNGRASLCVLTDAFFGQWVQIDGAADVTSLPEAMDALVGYYRAISGEHSDWDEYRAAMGRERRVVIRVTIEAVGPNVSG